MRDWGMLGEVAQVETKTLMVERFWAALEVQGWDLPPSPVRQSEIILEEIPMHMAHRVTFMIRLPGDVLQDNQEAARFPDGLWNTFKDVIKGWWPWSLSIRYQVLRIREFLVYPNVPVPEAFAKTVRLHVVPALSLESYLSK